MTVKLNKKVSTIIISSVCFVAIVFVTVGYMFKQGIISKDNLFTKNSSESESLSSESDSSNSDALLSNAYLKEGAECTLDCELKIDEVRPIYFKFNSLTVSKEIVDFDWNDDDYEWLEERDDNGTITNEYSYVICNFTIINNGETDFETTVNNLWLHYGSEGHLSELRSYNSGRTDTSTKDYYYVTFKPGVEHNFNLAYIVEDSAIDECKADMSVFIAFLAPAPGASYPVIEKTV